ncbi:MAG: DUF1631 family protein [Burkholderiales bacterium]|nr:DUF1631 family protein [Burkholderiales bacterium]
MDRNDILSAARAEFLKAFADAFAKLPPASLETLFVLAEKSPSVIDQRRYFDAHSALKTRIPVLLSSASIHLEKLINRSFQTAYSSFRPSFQAGASLSGLSLVDSTAYEGELRIDELTQRFRNAAEEQLRDLNIRAAILFAQDSIKDRENPFRPYLLARALMSAIEDLELPEEMAETLVERMASDFQPAVPLLYDRLNTLMAQHGIAAQLQLKVNNPAAQRRGPGGPMPAPQPRPADELAGGGVVDTAMAGGAGVPHFGGMPQPMMGAGQFGMSQAALSTGSFQALGESFEPRTMMGDVDVPYSDVGVQQMIEHARQRRGVASQMVASQSFETDSFDDVPGMPTGAGAMPNMGQAPAASQQAPAKSRGSWLQAGETMGSALRNVFSGGGLGGEASAMGDSQSAIPRVATALVKSVRTLVQGATPRADDMIDSTGEVRNLIMELRPKLNDMTDEVTEQMTIDIVAMLFEFILRDEHVPAEIRAQLGRLQFLVLRIALQDPALFTQKHHPARLLVNRIGSIAIGLGQQSGNDEKVEAEIRRIIETLLADTHESLDLFSKMLDELDRFVAQELRAADTQVERAVQVMESAESRTLRFARITAGIADAISGLTLDPYLRDFLVTPWAHAIERASRDNPAQAERLSKMVPDLLWSIAPKPTKVERDQLLALIPSLLTTLKEGLALTHWSADQQRELVSWMIDAHTHAMRAWTSQVTVPGLDNLREQVQLPPVQDESVRSARAAALDSALLEEAINEIEVELNVLDRMLDGDTAWMHAAEPEPEAATPESQAAEDATLAVLERLRSGVSVEINLDGNPCRARLNWVSPTATNLVLSIDGQAKPTAVSVKMFQRLMAGGRARFIEEAPLFERAVTSLLTSADQIDRNHKQPLARVLH